MTGHARPLVRVFVTGLLAALPLAATLAILVWAVQLLLQWVGPGSLVGSLFVALGFSLGGSQVLGYLLGVAMVAAGIVVLGVLVETGLQRGLARLVNGVMLRIPVVRTVYDMVRKMVGLFAPGQDDSLRSMSPVWCHFGGVGGAAALALLGSPEPVLLEGRRYLAVMVPTSPVPIGGGLLYVPEEWVVRADVGIDAVTSIYVSMGLTSAQHLGVAPPVAGSAAPVRQGP